MTSLQILFSLIPLMCSLSALTSPEAGWAICSCSACSDAGDAGGSWAGHSSLRGESEIPLPPSLALALTCLHGEPICLSNPTKALLFAKAILCYFVKWNWCTMGSDLSHSCLKIKHWQCMAWNQGKSKRGLGDELLIWSENCCNLCNDETCCISLPQYKLPLWAWMSNAVVCLRSVLLQQTG